MRGSVTSVNAGIIPKNVESRSLYDGILPVAGGVFNAPVQKRRKKSIMNELAYLRRIKNFKPIMLMDRNKF